MRLKSKVPFRRPRQSSQPDHNLPSTSRKLWRHYRLVRQRNRRTIDPVREVANAVA